MLETRFCWRRQGTVACGRRSSSLSRALDLLRGASPEQALFPVASGSPRPSSSASSLLACFPTVNVSVSETESALGKTSAAGARALDVAAAAVAANREIPLERSRRALDEHPARKTRQSGTLLDGRRSFSTTRACLQAPLDEADTTRLASRLSAQRRHLNVLSSDFVCSLTRWYSGDNGDQTKKGRRGQTTLLQAPCTPASLWPSCHELPLAWRSATHKTRSAIPITAPTTQQKAKPACPMPSQSHQQEH